MITIGYDPIFLDVIVQLQNETQESLAPTFSFTPGTHYPWSDITMIPGGNALNVAKHLSILLSEPIHFVGKISPLIQQLLEPYPNLHLHSINHDAPPNYTISLQTIQGEMQINSKKHSIAFHELNMEHKNRFIYSAINTYSNLGLNPHALQLFIELSKLILRADPASIPYKYSLFDPSTLQAYSDWSYLEHFLNDYFAVLPGMKIISINKEEYKQISTNLSLPQPTNSLLLIIHDTNEIIVKSKNEQVIQVPPLPGPIKNSLGAGDAFNAGFLAALYQHTPLIPSIQAGIQQAQQHLLSPPK